MKALHKKMQKTRYVYWDIIRHINNLQFQYSTVESKKPLKDNLQQWWEQ